MSAQEIYDEIISLIQNHLPSSWYVGITNDPQRRLREHNVNPSGNGYYFKEAYEHNSARAAEQALLQLGCTGGSGGGDHTCTFVYAYLKTPYTRE